MDAYYVPKIILLCSSLALIFVALLDFTNQCVESSKRFQCSILHCSLNYQFRFLFEFMIEIGVTWSYFMSLVKFFLLFDKSVCCVDWFALGYQHTKH